MSTGTWPEQDAVDKWLKWHGFSVAHHIRMELIEAVTKIRTDAVAAGHRTEDEKEITRWQDRVIKCIAGHGLVPFDASGCDSGDPLDFTEDQIDHAVYDAEERGYRRATKAALAALDTEIAKHPQPEHMFTMAARRSRETIVAETKKEGYDLNPEESP